MSMFQVQPQTPYDISIGQPGIAGTPTPVVSYAWTYNGTAIGDNSRFVNGYTFPEFPGTLACTITLTNIVGSVSQAVTASIQQVSNLPTLSQITIRNNAAPTVPITTIANGNAGVVLRVGGPTPPDVNPVSTNANTVSYQWRRGASDIAGATNQTYTMVAADEDSTVSVVVVATNLEGTTSRSAAVLVGDAAPNAISRIGSHAPEAIYWQGGSAFANCWYSQIKDGSDLTRNASHLLAGAWDNWTGIDTFTPLGWPKRTTSGSSIDEPNKGTFPYIWHQVWRKEVMWSALGLRGSYGDMVLDTGINENDELYFSNPPQMERTVSFDLSIYWRGTGTCSMSLSQSSAAGVPETPPAASIQTIQFAGPNNLGPWGTGNSDSDYNGPATMKKFTKSFSNISATTGVSMRAGICTSDPNDPVRDIILLVSNVRDAVTGEMLFAGYDETNYNPFQIHIPFYERYKYCRVMRSLGWGAAPQKGPIGRGRIDVDYNAPPVTLQLQLGGTDVLDLEFIPARWTHTHPSGMNRGLGAISHPGHSLFQSSPRALVELCNQLNAHLWFTHFFMSVYPVVEENGVESIAASLDSSGPLKVDEEHIDGMAAMFDAYLKPGLEVWNEFGNEIWNTDTSSFEDGTWFTEGMWKKVIAATEHGGDGLLWVGNRVMQSPAVHAGNEVAQDKNFLASRMYQAAASALITKRMREQTAGSGRVFKGVAAGQSKSGTAAAKGLAGLWLTQPLLFKHLDMLAHAPYRSPNWNPEFGGRTNATATDINLETIVDPDGDGIAENSEAAWQWLLDNKLVGEPYATPIGGTINTASWWGVNTVDGTAYSGSWGLFSFWKSIAIDQPDSDSPVAAFRYSRTDVPSGWSGKRRWTLELVTYEAGNHYLPVRPNAKLFTFQVMLDQRYRIFQRRYLETLFAPFKKPRLRAASNATESLLYADGRVPDGIEPEAREPLHSTAVMLTISSAPNYLQGQFWGQMWWLGHDDSPQFEILKEASEQGWGQTDWWLTYDGDTQ